MEIHNDTCIAPLDRETDFFQGVNGITFKATTEGDWTQFIDFNERQKIRFETDGCVLFSAQESFDAQMNQQIENGAIPQSLVDQLTSMGYMDGTSLDGNPRFHSSPRFLHVLAGTKHQGTALQTPWDLMRANGVLPWTDLPYDDTTTEAQYYSPILTPHLLKAAKFLQLIGGKPAIQYQWIAKGGTGTPIPKMKTALKQAPLCIGTAVCEPWDQDQPPTCSSTAAEHSTMVYNMDYITHIEDHYAPFLKKLAFTYNVSYIIQGVVSVVIPPPPVPVPPPLPPNPTKPQISSWLDSVRNWLLSILSQLKGRQFTSSTPMNSFLLALNTQDFYKGMIVAILTPIVAEVLTVLQQVSQGAPIAIDFGILLKLALSGGIAYITKNYFSDSNGNFLGIGSPKGTS